MSDPHELLPHLTLLDRAEDRDFHRRGGSGGIRIRYVDRQIHGSRIHAELVNALADGDANRAETEPTIEELRALGVIIVLQGADSAAPLRLDSLEQMSTHRVPRPKWLLLSVTPAAAGQPEQAVVWVSDEYRQSFLKLFEDYLDTGKDSSGGNPRNQELVANIAAIRRVVLRDLWQSEGAPPMSGTRWWELWLDRSGDGIGLLRTYAQVKGMALVERTMTLNDRAVVWIQARWSDLEALPFTAVPLAEIRYPRFIDDTIHDWPRDDQDALLEDLVSRVTVAAQDAPAVCHLDTGVQRTHALLVESLSLEDMHSVVSDSTGDGQGHGTLMAGLALYGPLDELLLSSGPVVLRHRLESVKILDQRFRNKPLTYGVVTAEGASAPEVVSTRRRVFCMPITCQAEAAPGTPSLWSAAVDALAVGTDVGRSDGGIALVGLPDPAAARLFVISAGNVQPHESRTDYRNVCDTSPIEDPAQAWNALTVGAHTDLVGTPSDPTFHGWSPLAPAGDISPFSRTSLLFSRQWPIKPDICMEGGNLLTNGTDFECHELLSLQTTGFRDDHTIGSARATSAATAQASRLAALAMVSYPSYWPETIRGLLVHAAEWTPAMRAEVDGATRKTEKLGLLRRYGWGVPDETAVLNSTCQSVTLVTQDEFVPFVGPDHRFRYFRLHRLPWPTETLRDLAEADVELRITLSYFIEPNASRRGWRRRYAYPSHGLRFELKRPLEGTSGFLARVNREAQEEEEGERRSGGDSDRWLVGPKQRNVGSLHQDIWEGSGAELADCGLIAVHPVGGWWKNNRRRDRAGLPLRYCLVVSLRTREQAADLYTPIATQLSIPVATAIEAM